MRLYAALTVASLKMYFRDRQALFWALFFPFLIMVIIGELNFGKFTPPSIGIVDHAQNEASQALVSALEGTPSDPLLNVSEGDEAALLSKVKSGSLDGVFVIPARFGANGTKSTVATTFDAGKAQQAGVALAILNNALQNLFPRIANVPPQYVFSNRIAVTESTIQGTGEGFQSFLVPGVAALAIMQAGIFGVVFSLVRFRATGVLRRLRATPIDPAHFLAGQIATRLIIAVLQSYILLVVGALILGVTIGGSVGAWLLLGLFSALGGALFISIGLAISGRAKNEDTAAPVSNIVAMPMMFLSGVFFPIDVLPHAISQVSRFLPLTYLADGMRAVATEGAGIGQVSHDLLGLVVWTVIAFAISARAFRWE